VGNGNRKTSKNWYLIVGIVLVLTVVGGWVAYEHFYKRDSPLGGDPISLKDDPLCTYVSDTLQMKCVVGLAAEGVLGPGHFVVYSPQAPAHTRVPFPDGDLFSKTCLVPGEQADALLTALKNQQQENAVAVGEFTYKLDRSFKAGAELPIPRLANLTVKAGPQLGETEQFGLDVPSAWLRVIDVNQFLELLDNAGIRKNCIDNLKSADYHVVSKALVGDGVHYSFTDKSGKSMDLSAAATIGKVSVNGGAGADTNVEQTIKGAASTPVVLAVEFMNPQLFKDRPKLSEPVVYMPSGQATVTVTGNGGEGALQERTQTANLGGSASLSGEGGESSECKGDVERTKSIAQVNSTLQSPASQTLEFSANGQIGGGHYATGHCSPFGGLIVEAGHDNGVSAVYSFSGYIRTTVRSDDAKGLTINFMNLPDNSHIEVRDPRGEPLSLKDEKPMQQLQGNGNLEFLLRGAGVYVAQVSATYRKSVNGAGRLSVRDSSSVSVSVH
jgi:hypothetical protein